MVAVNVRDDTAQEERQVSCVQSPGNHRHRRASWIKRERIPRRRTHRPAEKVEAWSSQGKIILGTVSNASARSRKRKPPVTWGRKWSPWEGKTTL